MDINNLFSRQPIEKKGEVFYFSKPSEDIVPSKDMAPGDKKTWSFWRRENFNFLEKELGAIKNGGVLIDIGAGQSDFAELTKQFSVCGVDMYPYPGIRAVCNLEEKLPFKDSVADVVMMTNLLEHVREPNLVLEEAYRILKPGGVFLATVPFLIQIHQRPYDFYRYTSYNLEYLLRKHHFSKIAVTPVSDLWILLFNTLTSFFVRKISSAKFKLPWRITWKMVRIFFAIAYKVRKNPLTDTDNPLGYVMNASK